jgi:hypothetical protein
VIEEEEEVCSLVSYSKDRGPIPEGPYSCMYKCRVSQVDLDFLKVIGPRLALSYDKVPVHEIATSRDGPSQYDHMILLQSGWGLDDCQVSTKPLSDIRLTPF